MEKFNTIRKFTYVVILGLFFSISGYATHIRAGEFSSKRDPVNPYKYEITLVLYYNSLSQASTDAGGGGVVNIQFGDGKNEDVHRQPFIDVGNNTSKNVFVVSHEFPGPSTYTIRMSEQNRNAGIKNIPGASDAVAFYVEMQLKVNPLYGLNSSPVMTVPPIDFGNVGKIFTHNPGAYDPDGDSLSYTLIPSKSAFNTPIPGYSSPASPIFGGQSTTGGAAFLTLDPVTGDLVWNTPSNFGSEPRYYNIAIQITEWRFGRSIGYTVRDMQVEIFEKPNNPPKLSLPKDTCIAAGKLLQATISATDPDGDRIFLQSYGQTYAVPSSPATFNVPATQPALNPLGNYAWQTNCSHVRNQPYQVVFKATDAGKTPALVDIQSWLIYVKGPKITGLTASTGFDFITLNWQPYLCRDQAEKINIYRIDCDSLNPSNDPCKTGPLAGYTLIGTVAANATSYPDNNNGKGLTKGKSYSYMLVAEYPAPGYGESFPSDQLLVALNLDVPVFNSIDVTKTSTATGEIALSWYKPSAPSVTAPYTYQLERAVGVNPAPASFTVINPSITDTFYTDINLDTKNSIYSYRIKLINNGLYTSSIPMFDVTAKAGNNVVNLTWNYEQPWIVDSIQVHRKINSGSFGKIATFNNSTAAYTDNAVRNCDTVFYQIKQFGRYCDKLLTKVATAVSAIDSVRPIDDRPLQAPILSVKGCNGDTSIFHNILTWSSLFNATCNTLSHYNVYFSQHYSDNLVFLNTTTDITQTYVNNFTTAGCYVVSATNLAGVEGAKSAKICVDDCPYYELPNLLTVNNDGKNDLVKAFPYPRGAAYVRYSVYNRWGALVFFRDTDVNINWDGSIDSDMLSDGIYYYSAEVHYYARLNPEDEVKTLKGWLQILTTK